MRTLFLLLITLFPLIGCIPRPTSTPVEIQQYPATWTPAPTPTNTPLPPTATLVIQRTPGALPSRNPNVRSLPAAPANKLGLWLSATGRTPKLLDTLLRRASVILTDGTGNFQLPGSAFVLFQGDAKALSDDSSLSAQYNGVVVNTTDAKELQSLRTVLGNRLLLVTVPISATASLASLIDRVDGVLLEHFLTEPDVPANTFPGEADWNRDIKTLSNLSARNNLVVLTSTRLADQDDSAVPVEQWANYALASFLLGANSSHTFFQFQSETLPQATDTPANAIEIGAPLGSPFKQNGVYQRRFAHGLVLVNPTNEPRAFALSRTYLDMANAHRDQVNMLPHTGMVLRITE